MEVLKENQGLSILFSLYGSLCPSGQEWQKAFNLPKVCPISLPLSLPLSSYPHPVLGHLARLNLSSQRPHPN